MNFEFATSTRIVFGPGTLRKLGSLAAELGRRALVVTGIGVGSRLQGLVDLLEAAGLMAVSFTVEGEPTLEILANSLALARQAGCDLVIGFGGGSAIDTGKATAVLLANPGDPLDYLEVIGKGKSLKNPSLPFIAIPTTAGTGAEVTRNAVLGVPEQGVKVSLRSPYMLPRLALIDPELTYDLPGAITASTGLDALTQVIEPFVTPQANPFTDAICREGIQRAARSLQRAYRDGRDAKAREDMSLASLFGGLALANAKLGAVHGFAAPLGGMIPAPHGAICARLLPLVMEMNCRALAARQPGSPALARYDEVARLLTGKPDANGLEGAAWTAELVRAVQIPGLSAYGLTPAHLPELIEKSAVASSMQGNPVKLTAQEMETILQQAL